MKALTIKCYSGYHKDVDTNGYHTESNYSLLGNISNAIEYWILRINTIHTIYCQ